MLHVVIRKIILNITSFRCTSSALYVNSCPFQPYISLVQQRDNSSIAQLGSNLSSDDVLITLSIKDLGFTQYLTAFNGGLKVESIEEELTIQALPTSLRESGSILSPDSLNPFPGNQGDFGQVASSFS